MRSIYVLSRHEMDESYVAKPPWIASDAIMQREHRTKMNESYKNKFDKLIEEN